MAGFEVIVRPVVFPNIRPAPARVLPPEDDPTQGFAVLGGSGGRLIDLPRSHSWSATSANNKETKRQYNVERIYQNEGLEPAKDEGEGGGGGGGGGKPKPKINKKNYVDVERMKKTWLRDARGREYQIEFANPPPADNIETLSTDNIRNATDI